jgi:SAM-dependent methyltransferase
MSLNSYIAKQFSNPTGLGGQAVTYVMNRQNRPLYEATIRLLRVSLSDHILDIGCGNGYVLNLLAQQYTRINLTGIDRSAAIVRTARRQNNKAIQSGKMTIACQDVRSLSFANETFDKAYSINTVYFWDNLEAPMQHIQRVLRPGGIFINTLYSGATLSRLSHTQYGYKHYTMQQLTESGERHGLTVKTVPILQGAAYCIVYQN